ncbi:MAG: zinc-dependent alcohol dehydrogenase family protein [Rhodobacterales bacterium]|nr:zinc-dependent alcohol dehydrogenase family protein [Rhodobacterales bacterium]MDX5411617.1 zinc-dependent alcohol dehydrogenase family protein [Rhodobacterales bacterium]
MSDIAVVTKPAPRAPGPGEVTVEMLIVTINPADLLMLEGRYGVRPPAPFIPGSEGVGRISAVGADVTLNVGDIVMPMPGNTWTEQITLSARHVVPLAADVDLEQAAMLKANPATALVMLEDIIPMQAGDWVILNAANSAVGQNVVKVGRALGLRVACVVRREGAAQALRDLGADVVIVDDGTGPAPVLPDGATARLALDAIGGTATERLAACVVDGGTVVNYGLLSGDSPRLSAHDLVFRGLTLRGFWLASWFAKAGPARIKQVYGQLVTWLGEGRIGARVDARYPITEAADAVAHAAREGRDGKVLITTRFLTR